MRAVFSTTALLGIMAAAVPLAAAPADENLRFDVPAGAAEDTIALFSQQSKRLILAPGDAVTGIHTSSVHGRYSFNEGLSRLLSGTPLSVASDDGRTIILVRRRDEVRAAPPVMPSAPEVETVTVSSVGYRASLESSTLAKRSATGFIDTVFAEDIGKFPDTNIAEALNRIPGITISREINGEGVNVQIRALGTNFTKVLLNGNPIAVGSTGATDATNTNREVDLNMFLPELFTELTVSKTLSADQLEGGAAGLVTLRSMRPFDQPGFHITYNVGLSDQTTTHLGIGKRGALIVSDTRGGFGVLVGLAGTQSNMMVSGWEDGNSGWVTPNLPPGVCGAGNVCGQFGGGSWTIPSAIPAGVMIPIPSGYTLSPGYTPVQLGSSAYFPASYPVSREMLYALNPGLADPACNRADPPAYCINQVMTRLSNTLLPRLGRPMFEKGSRDRYNAVAGFEYRADEDFNLYIDFIFGHVRNTMNRSDIGWGVRGGNSATQMIPVGLAISPDWLNSVFTSGLGGAASSGTFYNATFGLEARDYTEQGDFLNLNPGMSWRVSERLSIDFEAYYTRSHFFRTNPTVMASSCVSTPPPAGIQNCPNGPPSLGTVLNFNAAGNYPSETINIDLNDPRNYEWYLGRVNLSGEKRYTNTKGAHLDFAYGSELFMLKTGVAYDEAYRLMTTIDDTATWQEKVCGDNPSVVLLPPNSQLPPCTGQVAAVPADWNRPAYPGYGSGYSAGAPPLAFRGSLIPAASLADYLIPGPTGFVTVDYAKFFAASDYNSILSRAVESVRCIPHCSLPGFPANTVLYPGFASAFDERNTGIYAKVAGGIVFHTRMLKYDVGLRWVETRQNVISPYLKTDPRNASLQDGGYYPNYYQLVPAKSAYHALLPSASFVYELDDAMQLRFSLSRSMNRPNPNAMSGVISFSDPNVTTATLGNSYLRPYFSNNIDIGAEYYLGREGYVGVAFFRKSISGFTAQITKTQNFSFLSQYGITWSSLGLQQQMNYQTSGGPSGVPCNSDASCADHPVAVNQQVNLPGLEIINGLEIDYVQPLDRLFAGIGLEGFGFSGNLTIIDQKSTGNVATYAIGVAPYQYNVTGFYERNGIMLRLSYNWNDGSYGSSTNNQNVCFPALPGGDRPAGCSGGSYLFNSPYGQLDMSSSLKLSRLFGSIPSDPALTFEVQNLLNAKQSTYGQMKSAVHSYYEKGQTLLVGVRGAL